MSEELKFDPESHTYTKDGRVLPSVTQVLSWVNIIDTSWFTEDSAWRGSVVHRCCELDDENDLDEVTVPEIAKGYLDAWRRFKNEVPMKFVSIEKQMSNDLYAGTLDRDAEWAIIDLKTGAIQPWVALQLAAYVELARGAGSKSCSRYAVRLSKNGKYKVQEFPVRDLRNDLGIFRAALSIYYWRST